LVLGAVAASGAAFALGGGLPVLPRLERSIGLELEYRGAGGALALRAGAFAVEPPVPTAVLSLRGADGCFAGVSFAAALPGGSGLAWEFGTDAAVDFDRGSDLGYFSLSARTGPVWRDARGPWGIEVGLPVALVRRAGVWSLVPSLAVGLSRRPPVAAPQGLSDAD
jgi:hypothetical protein